MKLKLYTDGASRGNPGKAAWCFRLLDADDDSVVMELAGRLPNTTNNVAEYHAIINGLSTALQYSPESLEVFSDSEVAIKQLLEVYQCRAENLVHLKREASKLISQLEHKKCKVSLTNVRRENSEVVKCDKMCNSILDNDN